jgi:glycerol uptake facilitator-like aquaporin
MTSPLSRALCAEALGTAILLAVVVGSGIMAESLAAGNAAVALLGNTLATAAALVVLISSLGRDSGAHFNPIVTLALAMRGHFPWQRVFPYLAVQFPAAVLGVWLAHLMFDLPLLQESTKLRWGQGQWLSEAVASFALVSVILTGIRQGRAGELPALVALTVTAGYWFTASTSFANPAVTLARSLTDSFAGIRPADAPWFMVAQLAGMVLAVALDRLAASDRVR